MIRSAVRTAEPRRTLRPRPDPAAARRERKASPEMIPTQARHRAAAAAAVDRAVAVAVVPEAAAVVAREVAVDPAAAVDREAAAERMLAAVVEEAAAVAAERPLRRGRKFTRAISRPAPKAIAEQAAVTRK
jgi:hypothetical protein